MVVEHYRDYQTYPEHVAGQGKGCQVRRSSATSRDSCVQVDVSPCQSPPLRTLARGTTARLGHSSSLQVQVISVTQSECRNGGPGRAGPATGGPGEYQYSES
eukprot:477391-Rhodomonas_salina.2